MFKTRLLSGIVLVILALVLIITGKEVLLISTLAISCIGMYELYRVFKIEKSLLAGLGYIAALVFYCNLEWNFIPDIITIYTWPFNFSYHCNSTTFYTLLIVLCIKIIAIWILFGIYCIIIIII